MIPCKDCIVLVMCKERAKNYYNEKKFTHSNQRLMDNTILRLAYDCEILYKYCEISTGYDLNIEFDTIILNHNSGVVMKAHKYKLTNVKQVFKFPEGADDNVQGDM